MKASFHRQAGFARIARTSWDRCRGGTRINDRCSTNILFFYKSRTDESELSPTWTYRKSRPKGRLIDSVEIPGFEPGQTEPKSVVLPLHHISIPGCKDSIFLQYYNPSFLKKSLPLSSTRMNAGKSSTWIFQIASIPSSGYSTHSMLLMLF